MKEVIVEAKTIEEATAVALKKLNAKRENVEIKILSEESRGLFGMHGAKPAKIKVKIKEKDVRG